MHPNGVLVERLYSSLNQHLPNEMAKCYHANATFRDIAFDLRGQHAIGGMWRMICAGDIRAKFEVVHAGDESAVVKLVDEYTFTDTGRKVKNEIESRFRFQDGLIVEHLDSCDEKAWAAAAIGGVGGFLAGRFRFLRAWKAKEKLDRFVAKGQKD